MTGKRIRNGVKEGVIPLLVFVVSVIILVVMFRMTRRISEELIQPSVNVAGEETNPTIGRLLWLVISGAGGITLALISSCMAGKKKHKNLVYLLGSLAGTLMWQALGECSWNYGFWVEGQFTNFPRMECAQGWFIFIPFTIFFFLEIKRNTVDFGLQVSFLALWANWYGHIMMIGTYPFAGVGMTEEVWYQIMAVVAGVPLLIFSIWLMFSEKTNWRYKHLSALLFYAAFGTILFGLIIKEK